LENWGRPKLGQSLKVKVGIFLFSQLKIKPPFHKHTHIYLNADSLPFFLPPFSLRVCVCVCLCGFHNDVIGMLLIGPAFCLSITYLPCIEPAFLPALSLSLSHGYFHPSSQSLLLSPTSFHFSRLSYYRISGYFLSPESATAGCSSVFWANELGLQGHCSCRRVTLRKAATETISEVYEKKIIIKKRSIGIQM